MYPSLNRRALNPSLLVLLLLICGAGLVIGAGFLAQPTTAAMPSPGRPPVRLRLKVDTGTLRAGQATRVQAEFLDVDYQPVPSDGTRMIEFGISGGGTISPLQVTVRPGVWTADTTFVSAQPGKVILTARTGGLDPAQTMVVVVRQAASFLSQLFDPVAYAQGPFHGFQLYAADLSAPANNHARVSFKIAFDDAPPIGTRIRLSVNPPAVLVWG